jgi:hypothetical protein
MHIFQVLDHTLLEVFKKQAQYELPFDYVSSAIDFVLKVYHTFVAMIIVAKVLDAFHTVGLGCDCRSELCNRIFQERKLREFDRLQELSSLDLLPEDLLSRRCSTRGEWINNVG